MVIGRSITITVKRSPPGPDSTEGRVQPNGNRIDLQPKEAHENTGAGNDMKEQTRRFLMVLLGAALLFGAVGCESFRAYIHKNDRMPAKAFYEDAEAREYMRQNDRVPARAYYESETAQEVNKLNDDMGPKHAYYYE